MKQMMYKGMHILHVQEYAERPTLVFLHDSLGCIQLWRGFPEKVAKATQCNLLIYERLGYGQSSPMPTYIRPVNYLELEADLLNELLAEFKIENAILFGHSDGGSIAIIAAGKHPQSIRAVICEAAHIFVEDVTLKGIYEAKEAYQKTSLPQRLEKYHGKNVEMLFKAWTETWARDDFRDWNIEHFIPAIHCPLLFIQGENDEYGTLAQVENTVNHTSGKSEIYIIPNIGHTPHKEAPEKVLDKAVAFILQQEK